MRLVSDEAIFVLRITDLVPCHFLSLWDNFDIYFFINKSSLKSHLPRGFTCLELRKGPLQVETCLRSKLKNFAVNQETILI